MKELWGKLVYSLSRASTSLLFKGMQALFQLFSVASFENKDFYHQFVLKKLEFEKLFEQLNKRLGQVFSEIVALIDTHSHCSIAQLKTQVQAKALQYF